MESTHGLQWHLPMSRMWVWRQTDDKKILNCTEHKWGVFYQNQVSRVWTSYYTPHLLCNVLTCPRLSYQWNIWTSDDFCHLDDFGTQFSEIKKMMKTFSLQSKAFHRVYCKAVDILCRPPHDNRPSFYQHKCMALLLTSASITVCDALFAQAFYVCVHIGRTTRWYIIAYL